jgi:hypothetical protein
MSTSTSVIERLRTRIGKASPPVSAAVEAGHLKGFAEAIGDPNPRWLSEAPPTFLVALAPAMIHLEAAEAYGKGWLNGGNRFEYVEPVRAGDTITATGKMVDVREKSGSSGNLLFIVFETEYVNQHGRTVARLRGTAIRR